MACAANLAAVLLLGLASACCAQGVSKFGPLRVGDRAPFGPGEPTAHPYRRVPVSRFYVFVVAKGLPTMCVFEECGKDGALVHRLGGWITGDEQSESIAMVGLTDYGVRSGKESVVVIADAKVRIIGIYPNAAANDLRSLLRQHPKLGRRERQ
jgi:hypothetical protein